MKKLLSLILALSLLLSACSNESASSVLNREILNDSLDLGTEFLLNNQLEEGNFNYEYNYLSGKLTDDDNQVRQAGALWGISLIHRYDPTQETLDAILKGLEFFDGISKTTSNGGKYVVYPDGNSGKSGTIALITLSLIELLNSDFDLPNREHYLEELNSYLTFLMTLRREDGLFHSKFSYEDGTASGDPSPYVDGEGLLAMVKAAKFSGYNNLKPLIFESAEEMQKVNVDEALKENPDSDTTKGYFQWGIMSYFEIATTEWENISKFDEQSIELAYWMIDVHKTLDRSRNTAYAYEGIISAYELAKLSKDRKASRYFKSVIDEGLYKLTSWQVGSMIENEYIQNVADSSDQLSLGGVMNLKNEPLLRIDVTQHQMHSVILALEYVY